MATPANHDRETTQPTCQNCTTSTTPLWRRDEMGSVLCNACGLFLKLHGRPRPISLKTDVIKSRNRVKTSMRPDMAMKKKVTSIPVPAPRPAHLRGRSAPSLTGRVVQQQQAVSVSTDVNGADLQSQANAAAAVLQARRTSQKSANGHVEGADSPVSRTATPNMYNPHLPGYPGMDDTQYQAQTLAGFAVAGASPGRATSPLNGERLDVPQTQEQLIAANSSLKTRVSELEVINDFMQRRLAVFEYGGAHEGQETGNQTDAQLRAQLEQSQQSEAQFKIQMEQAQMSDATAKAQLEESHRRENMLKRRLDELETELKDAKAALEAYEGGRAKKPRLTDMINDPDESTPRAEE